MHISIRGSYDQPPPQAHKVLEVGKKKKIEVGKRKMVSA